jgi:hypothetical protein
MDAVSDSDVKDERSDWEAGDDNKGDNSLNGISGGLCGVLDSGRCFGALSLGEVVDRQRSLPV